MNEIVLSIVVGTIDRPAQLSKLISSVVRNTKGIQYEMLIADASSRPAVATDLPENVYILREWPRLGHAAGYNKLFRQAKGKWVVWLNDDVEVEPEWAKAAVDFMETAPWCGLGCIYYSESGGAYCINAYQGMIYANFGIISKSLGDTIDWFDEDVLRMYGADNSLTFKVYLQDMGVMGIAGSKIRHNPIMDSVKIQNVEGQAADAAGLMGRYRPLVDRMLEISRQFPSSPLMVQ